MNKENFDHIFDTAFEEVVEKHLSSPDPDPSWSKVEALLEKKRKKPKFRFFPYAAAVTVIMGAFAFAIPTATKAFNPFIHTMKSIQSGVVSLIFGNDSEHEGKAKTAAPPDNGNSDEGQVINSGLHSEKNYKTWEEAAQNVAFSLSTIGFVPQDFLLHEVVLYFDDRQEIAKRAVLMYTNQNEGKSFILTIRMLERNETVTTGTDKNAGEYEKVEVNGQPAYLLLTKDKRSSLDYMTGNTLISISGALTKDEIIKVAEQIK